MVLLTVIYLGCVCFLSLDAKHHPEALGADVGGVRNATSGSVTDKLTREHRMTLDEAHLILNVKRGEAMESIIKASRYLVVCKRRGS